MRWCVSIGAVLCAGAILAGDITGIAAPATQPQLAESDGTTIVDVELVLAVDVSYSMSIDDLAIQREGYAQAIVSNEFLEALKTGPKQGGCDLVRVVSIELSEDYFTLARDRWSGIGNGSSRRDRENAG
jgi:hypothetical protein